MPPPMLPLPPGKARFDFVFLFSGDDLSEPEKHFLPIVERFVQDGGAASLTETVAALLAALRLFYPSIRHDPKSFTMDDNVEAFSSLCTAMAMRIPYDHPAQTRLVDLIEELGLYPPFQDTPVTKVGGRSARRDGASTGD